MIFWKFQSTISDLCKTITCISTFAFLTTNSVFWLICILEQFGFGYYVAGTPVTVGVTMYVLSISSVSEVMMVLKNLCSKKNVFCLSSLQATCVPIMCLIDASSRVATNHHDDLDLFTFLFSNRMLLDKWKLRDFE